ncbi:MAG: substrate-binding domain-containing protein, partial [Planctomycetales bacterium]|nr:substrate-binding domain-containing protein [Planctomycetales bacterium]
CSRPPGEYEIATVVKVGGIPWFNRMEEGVHQAAKQLGVDAYLIGPTQADEAQQVRMVEDLISKGVDAICVVPNDSRSLEPVFAKAKAAGIKV